MRSLWNAPENEFAKIKYVLTDIDDTLTYRGKLSARTYSALERLQTAGVKVIPVTAAPAGWCDLMVRMWPINAVIAENGGVYNFKHANHVERIFWMHDTERADAKKRLLELERQIEIAMPSAKLASDQVFRLTSVAWEKPSNAADTSHIIDLLLGAGARATVNSLWVFDPPSMKWSDLKYVFWHQGGPICRGGDTSPKRSSPS